MQPVVKEFEGLAFVDLAHEGEREQEGGDEEEDVHTAGDPAEPDVVEHDEEHREGSQALDFGAEPSRFDEFFEGVVAGFARADAARGGGAGSLRRGGLRGSGGLRHTCSSDGLWMCGCGSLDAVDTRYNKILICPRVVGANQDRESLLPDSNR